MWMRFQHTISAVKVPGFTQPSTSSNSLLTLPPTAMSYFNPFQVRIEFCFSIPNGTSELGSLILPFGRSLGVTDSMLGGAFSTSVAETFFDLRVRRNNNTSPFGRCAETNSAASMWVNRKSTMNARRIPKFLSGSDMLHPVPEETYLQRCEE